MRTNGTKLLAATVCLMAGLFAGTAPAQGAAEDPLFVFVPVLPKTIPPPLPVPPPAGSFSGPCGMGVDSAGRFYVSDYYHDTVDAYDQNADFAATKPPPSGATGYLGQLAAVDSLDGPCGLAFDTSGALYVNDYHRAVIRFGSLGSFGAGTTITGAMVDGTHPTGVAVDPTAGRVYVDERTYVSVYDEGGATVMDGAEPLRIGEDSLQDGYGIATSQFPGTAGRLYVPDAATDTVKVYDPAIDKADPVEEIDGAGTPNGAFVSLRDTAVAVDRVTGEIYVLDNLQPDDTDQPRAIVDVFSSAGAYEGHLKVLVTDALPAGLAVDNSTQPTQGRVYVTSGNGTPAAIYAYGPGAATSAPLSLPSFGPGVASTETAAATIRSDIGGPDCGASCKEATPAAAPGASLSTAAVPPGRHAKHRHQHKHRQRPHRPLPRGIGASR